MKIENAFKIIEAKKISDFVFQALEEVILLKEILPGERLLTERELAQQFGVSRITIREAILKLESMGLIERKRGANGGTFVRALTMEEHKLANEENKNSVKTISQFLEFRDVIEGGSVKLAAGRISKEQLTFLHSTISEMQSKNCSREKFRVMDTKFHLTIANASKNAYFESNIRQIRTKLNYGFELMPYDGQVQKKTIAAHTEIYEALQSSSGAKAESLMLSHIRATSAALLDILSFTEGESENGHL